MKPAPFAYHRARSVADALEAIAGTEDAVFLAGGQSLVPMLNLRMARPALLVDLNDCAELSEISIGPGNLHIGALVRHHRLASDPEVRRVNPLIAAAAGTIGYYPIRQRGTIGGSLAHADPAAQWPLLAVLFDAGIELRSVGATRKIAARELFLSVFMTAREPAELITAVTFPLLAPGEGWGHAQLSKVAGDFAVASAAATVTLEKKMIRSARLAVGAVCDVPVAVDCAPLLGRTAVRETIAAFAQDAAARLAIDDTALLSADDRRDAAEAMIADALIQAARAGGDA